MKKQTLTSLLVLFALILGASPVRAGESYRLILDGLTQSSEGALYFDLYLENTGQAFYLHDVHAVVRFNPGITGSGAFDPEAGLLVAGGSSELLYPPSCNDFVLSQEGNAFVLSTPEPELSAPVQLVAPGTRLRVAQLRVILSHEGLRGVFPDIHPGFYLCEDESRVRHCQADEDGLKTGAGAALTGGELLCLFGDRPLASRYFYGEGYWHAADGDKALHWNIHPDTHPDFAWKLPAAHNNVVIGGLATIAEGQQVLLSAGEKGAGGTLIIETAEKPTYRIHLVANGEGVEVQLRDHTFINILSTPIDVYEGTMFYISTLCDDPETCGSFVNWTDQFGNVVQIIQFFGPIPMPAAHTTLTANWTSGTFDKSPHHQAEGLPEASWREEPGKRITGEEDRLFPELEGQKRAEDLYSGLTIAPGAALTVNRLLNRHERGGEALVLQSRAGDDAAGSLIHGNTGVEVTVERYIGRRPAGNTYRGWHLLSSPVEEMPLQPAFVPEPQDGILPAWFDFYKWDESHVEEHNGQNLTGWWINVKTGGVWNEDFEHDFLPGRGYLVSYGDPGKEGSKPGEAYGDRIHRFTGVAMAEDVLAGGLTHTPGGDYAGWHLLGNPFTSALHWAPGAWPQSGILGGPLLWSEANAGYVPVIDIIPAMNGFMIQSSGNGHLLIPPAARVHNSLGWHKNGPASAGDSGLTPHIRLAAVDREGGTAQESVVLFRREATHHYDPAYDTPFMPGYAPHFYSLAGGTPLSLNSRPSDAAACPAAQERHFPAGNMYIPFGFQKNASDVFEIALLQQPEGVILGLEDRLTGQLHALGADRPYAFVSAEGDAAERFVLHVLTEGTMGTGDVPDGGRLRVYAHDHTITVFTPGERTLLQVVDVQGRVLVEQRLAGAGTHSIGVRLPHGVYVVCLRTEYEEVREKVVW